MKVRNVHERVLVAAPGRVGELIDGLEGRYGNLGIVVDEGTGEITGMLAARKKVIDAMRAQAIRELENRRREIQQSMGQFEAAEARRIRDEGNP